MISSSAILGAPASWERSYNYLIVYLLGLHLWLNAFFGLIFLRASCCSGGGGALLWWFGVFSVHQSCCQRPCRWGAAARVQYGLLPLPSLTQTSPTAPRWEGISWCLPVFLGLLMDEWMWLLHRKIRFFSVSSLFPSQDLSMCTSATSENAYSVFKTLMLAALWLCTHWSGCFIQPVAF
jgi:hypothetical protein